MATRDDTTRVKAGRRRAARGYAAALGADPGEIADVRVAVADLAARTGFRDRVGDLALALGEILANAQEHGRPPIEVSAWADGRLVVIVSDRGAGFDRLAVWGSHPPVPEGCRGRGLWIARQLSDLLHVDCADGATVIRLELSPEPHIGA